MKPLAYRMRPQTIDEIVGQQHLVGKDKPIRLMVESGTLFSMILYGPPGIGKTSIASAIAGTTGYQLKMFNASTDSKKELIAIAEIAKDEKIILLLDEIHRLDKPKQDFLLPQLENGNIVLIGATTENPYITINPAIRSRATIYELHTLTEREILIALVNAIKNTEVGLGEIPTKFDKKALILLGRNSNGDVRSALNQLELVVMSTKPDSDGVRQIGLETVSNITQTSSLNMDKDGDQHYNVISAFQKSIRGSDVDAALHYLARLLLAGDLVTIVRRLTVTAYEDIGLSSPDVVYRAIAATEVALKVGMPEARIPLANAVIELCLAPKSNSAVKAIDKALSDIKYKTLGEIPKHLKDTHFKGAEKLGHTGYEYPHDYSNGYVTQQYLPDNLEGSTKYFDSKGLTDYESYLKESYDALKKM